MHGKISSSEEGFERAHTIKFNRYISARDFVQFISIRFPSPILAYNCIVPSSGLSGFRQSSLFQTRICLRLSFLSVSLSLLSVFLCCVGLGCVGAVGAGSSARATQPFPCANTTTRCLSLSRSILVQI